MLLAEVQSDVLARSLLIALLVVTPYGIYKLRQVRAVRADRIEAEQARDAAIAAMSEPEETPRPRLEVVIDEITDLGTDPGVSAPTVTIPHGVTVGGSDAPPGIVDTLVRDALRRSGLVATAEIDTPDGRVLELARVGH